VAVRVEGGKKGIHRLRSEEKRRERGRRCPAAAAAAAAATTHTASKWCCGLRT
jgi:hypothetical protein